MPCSGVDSLLLKDLQLNHECVRDHSLWQERRERRRGEGDYTQWHQEVKAHFAARFLHQLNTY